jgi:beta-N-acetylhexosaminidase
MGRDNDLDARESDLDARENDLDTCLLGRFPGPVAPDWLLRWLDDGLGGVLLFAGNITGPGQLRDLVATLREHKPDVLVAVDEEGGIVTRLEAGTGSSFPGNASLGAIADLSITRRVAASIGTMLAAAGINLDLAPVADVDSNPASPVIGVRSFGSDPGLVAAHTAAFVAGLQSLGVAACAKHWPGHGRASADSHLELPVVPASLADLRDSDLLPFAAAIEAGVRAIMTAHVVYPAVDSQPATLSATWLGEVLRRDLGFDGVIITDALEMAAIGDGAERSDGAVRALAAGADLLCLPASQDAQEHARAALADALTSGVLPVRRVAEAAARVRALAAWARPGRGADPDLALGEIAAARALLIEGVPGPLQAAPFVADAGGRMSMQLDDTAASLLGVLGQRMPGTEGIRIASAAKDTGTVVRDVLTGAIGRPLVVAVSDAHRKPWQADILAGLLAARPDAIVVGTGTTHDRGLAGNAYIGTRGAGRVNLVAAADVLAGRERPVQDEDYLAASAHPQPPEDRHAHDV